MTVLFPSKAILIPSEMHFPPQFSQLVMKLCTFLALSTTKHFGEESWYPTEANRQTAFDSDGLKLGYRFSPKLCSSICDGPRLLA